MKGSIYTISETGAYHRQAGLPNQDAVLRGENGRYLAAALADGVSSCSRADAGARIACRTAVDLLLRAGDQFFRFETEQITYFAAAEIRRAIETAAEEEGDLPEEYSSTAAFVLLDKKSGRLLWFNLGDGLILGVREERCTVLSAPDAEGGRICVTTTEGAETTASAGTARAGEFSALFLCTDGAWRRMYERGRLTDRARELLLHPNEAGLREYLAGRYDPDDYSCIFWRLDK